MITINFNNINILTNKLRQFPAQMEAALLARSESLAATLVHNVQDGKLSGEVLQDKTGILKNSIASEVSAENDGTSASVFVAGDVPYAAILEYGGQTKAHIIEASQGKALAFTFLGKQSFFKAINHPGSNIPAFAYLRSALEEMQEDIMDGFTDALAEALPTER